MRLRALGTGHLHSRHPLCPSSFLVQSEGATAVLGCGPSIPAKLEALGVTHVDIWSPLNTHLSQVGGLEEIAHRVGNGELIKQTVAGPEGLLTSLRALLWQSLGQDPNTFFSFASTRCINIREEHAEEAIHFVPNFLREKGGGDSFGLHFEEASIFISGDTTLNAEWLHQWGMPSELILHSCTLGSAGVLRTSPTLEEMRELPLYMQNKIWLYGYENRYIESEDPVPMLFLLQGATIYDSDRKDKLLSKERFMREEAKRQVGNQRSLTVL